MHVRNFSIIWRHVCTRRHAHVPADCIGILVLGMKRVSFGLVCIHSVYNISNGDGKQIEEKLRPWGWHVIQCDFSLFGSYLFQRTGFVLPARPIYLCFDFRLLQPFPMLRLWS